MSNPASGARRAQQKADRLHWLCAHRELLVRLPTATEDVERDHSDALDDAVKQMKHVRLYAPSSTADSVRWGIRLLVSELRGASVPTRVAQGRRV